MKHFIKRGAQITCTRTDATRLASRSPSLPSSSPLYDTAAATHKAPYITKQLPNCRATPPKLQVKEQRTMDHPQTPRILAPHLSNFQHKLVRILGKVTELHGETAVIDAGGNVDVILNRVGSLLLCFSSQSLHLFIAAPSWCSGSSLLCCSI